MAAPSYGGMNPYLLGTCESAVCVRIEYESNQKRCAETDSSFQSSSTLNNTGVWSLVELASLYTVPLSAVHGLSRLTTTADSKIFESTHDFRIESNRNGRFESNRISKLRRYLATGYVHVLRHYLCFYFPAHRMSQSMLTAQCRRNTRPSSLLCE